MSGYRLHLEIARLPACNASRNVHWRTKQKERGEWAVLMRHALGVRQRPRTPLRRARLTLTRRSSRRPDFDNQTYAFKILIDLLQPDSKRNPGGLGIILNDNFETIGIPDYRWELERRGRVAITVEEITE